ncbi:TraM recognition domain-containing protein [Listeria booriae]|uniref:TraM recognition domain-containing protein n=1 Tax=Listeria booriae TaxID=1552123 RepID=A0A7X1BW86_9LIST|nr:TraM recognition domain-containing protein [Listeria booriae]MBC1333534.1 TraM recognition domain-containing protein [Listeria booriae]MBC1618032.1 TraM recognition domain-containing protein [Listeria booriae]
MLNKNLFGQEERKRGKEEPKTRLQATSIIIACVGFIFYPFVMTGFLFASPLLYYHFVVDRKQRGASVNYEPLLYKYQKYFWMGSGCLFLLNAFAFAKMMPRSYLSAYELFPLQQIGSPLTIGWGTLPALFVGGVLFACLTMLLFILADKQKIETAEQRRNRIKSSKEYLERRKNRFRNAAQIDDPYAEVTTKGSKKAIAERNNQRMESIYIGIDEYGQDAWLPRKEMNQHTFVAGTTGAGKTTLLEVFLNDAGRMENPVLFIDGKGSPDTRRSVEEYAKKHNRPLKIFSDEHDLRYNPIKYGNSIVIKDKLISMAKTESTFYSTAAEKLLMFTTQLMDQAPKLKRDFPTFSRLLNGSYVLEVFEGTIDWDSIDYDKLYKRYSDLFDGMMQKVSDEPEQQAEKAQEVDEEEEIVGTRGRLMARQNFAQKHPEQGDTIKQLLKKIPIYRRLKMVKKEMTPGLQSLFFDLLESYEASEGGIFNLYSLADNLRSNVDLLLKSEIGYLFDTSKGKGNELDLMEVDAENAIVYVALNGLIYQEFIESLAHFFVGEVNFLASYRYKQIDQLKQQGQDGELKPFFFMCDEPATYISDNFMDTVNKTRGAGIHAVFSPQTITDLKLKNELLARILVGNANTYLIGRLNDPDEAEYISKLVGTFKDIELTEVIQQEEGFGNANRINWSGDKGTKREVSSFKIHPDTIKELKKGEFVFYRKASEEYEEPHTVYVRKP